MSNREILADAGYEDARIFDEPEYDTAIVGVTDEGQVVYDFEKMVKHLMENDGITREEAIEFIEYNTIRSLPYFGEEAPIIMNSIENL